MISILLASIATVSPQMQIEGQYVARVGQTVLFTEQVTFDGTTLTTDLELPSRQMRFEGVTVYERDLDPQMLEFNILNSQTGDVIQEVSFRFSPDSVAWTGSGQSGTVQVTRPRGMLFNPVFGHTAVILLQGVRDEAARTPNVMLESVNLIPMEITFTDENNGSVNIATTTMQFRLNDDGWLVEARVPSQGLVVTFEEGEAQEMSVAPAMPENERPSGVSESEYSFSSGDLTIHGTLTTPEAGAGDQAVLIVAGSGPTDRDGNQATGLRTDVYKLLAWELASHGFASLRYDKRGLSPDHDFAFNEVVLGDYISDAANGANALLAERGFNEVILLGHSEGGIIVTAAADEVPHLAGVILMATPGRDLVELIREQVARQVDAETMADFNQQFDSYLAGRDYTAPQGLEVLLAPVNQRFTASLVDYNPAELAAELEGPVLILQGTEDPQVSVRDAELLSAALPSATVVITEGTGHLFKQGDPELGIAVEYTDPLLPLHSETVDAIGVWLNRLTS